MLRPALPALALLSCWGTAASPAAARPVLVLMPGDTRAVLLGGWQGGRWLSAAATVPGLRAGEPYRVQDLGGRTAQARGSRVTPAGDPCEDSFTVGLSPLTASGVFRTATPSAVNTRPRTVTILATRNETYRRVVRDELVRRGLRNPQVNLLGLTRADLDGDGTAEVVIEAAHYAERAGLYPPPTGQPGDYSLLLLRSVQGGRAQTTVLGQFLAPETPSDPGSDEPMPLASLFRLAGLADLNGDSRLEVLTFSSYYEGYGLAASEWTPRGGVKTRLETGCGV